MRTVLKFFETQNAIVLGIGVIVFWLLPSGSFAGKGWEAITELPTKRVDFSTAVVNDKIYLIGGTLVENADPRKKVWISTVEVYDPKSNKWQRVSEMPTPRAYPMSTVVDGRIYVLGGYSGNFNTLRVVEVYDPKNDTWEQKQDMPSTRLWCGVEAVDESIYVIGGGVLNREPGAPGRLDLVEVYDPKNDTWDKLAKMSTKREGLGAAVVSNRIYAIGGFGWPENGIFGGPYLKVIEAYNPRTNEWRKKTDMLEERLNFATVVIAEKIYLIAGWHLQKGLPTNLATVDVYDPKTGEWSDIPPLPTPITPLGAAGVDGKIYVFGGTDDHSVPFPDVFVFDTGFRAVTAIGKLPRRWGQVKEQRQSP